MRRNTLFIPVLLILLLVVGFACSPSSAQTFVATLPALQVTAPFYTNTPRPADSPTPSPTLPPSLTPEPSSTSLPSATSTLPPTPEVTQAPVVLPDAGGEAPLSATTGWSCDDFPCEDDLNGWLQRIQVPPGYRVEYVGRFPGQPMQITYGGDSRLYATVLENGTRNGAVYVMDGEGAVTRYSGTFVSPLGLAFQPGTDVLYVSAREMPMIGGGVWRVSPDGTTEQIVSGLPCCFRIIDNQPGGMIFGQDGFLYMGVGSLSDTTANPPRSARAWMDVQPYEASILRIDPSQGTLEVFAQGIRNPFDLTQDSSGQFYTTDTGLLTGIVNDRVLRVEQGGHYGWPYWGGRGCGGNCPLQPNVVRTLPDLLELPPFTLPRGLVAYTGAQFPANLRDSLFVAFWNGVEGGQRIVRIDPARAGERDYVPEAFVTGLIRPIDVAIAPDGSLVVADYVYGNVWRIIYER